MKKIFFLSIALLFIACQKKVNFKNTSHKTTNDSVGTKLVIKTLTFLKTKNFDSIAKMIHPEENLRFSPYEITNIAVDKYFSEETFMLVVNNKIPIKWGYYDGTGSPIDLTWNQYYKKFVYDRDYLNDGQIKIKIFANDNNNKIKNIYKDCQYAYIYINGKDKKLNEMDWRSLKLIFKKYLNDWKLVGIVHNQWTI